MSDHPHEGGSYLRQKDGTLKRVAWTKPEEATPAPTPIETATEKPAEHSPGNSRKAKE